MSFKALMATGGTGGHVFPAMAVAKSLAAQGVKVDFVIDRSAQVKQWVLPTASSCDMGIYPLASAGMGGGVWSKAKACAKLGLGYMQAWKLLCRLRPDVVAGFGGYASFPAMLAAYHQKIPILLHEQNVVMGRANKVLSARASVIATSFAQVENMAASLKGTLAYTGNPVRAEIAGLSQQGYVPPEEGSVLHLLVLGGSQGASFFDDVVPRALGLLPAALRTRLFVTQQCSAAAQASMEAHYQESGLAGFHLAPFFADVATQLRQAHLVISRAGAGMLAELAVASLPALMVPYPYAAANHQARNAAYYAAAGAGWIIPQDGMAAGAIAGCLQEQLETPKALVKVASAMQACGMPDAADRVAQQMQCLASRDG